jgi:hypothetical protein
MDARRSEVRSFREVFALERRIYRIDRLRLNPTGVPVRGVAYSAALLVLAQLADGLPLLGELLGLAPWPLRDLVAPVTLAAALALLRVDGRPAHDALVSAARFALGARQLSGFERREPIGSVWRPGALVVITDGSESHLRELTYRGPGDVLVDAPHTRRTRHGRGELQIDPGSESDQRRTGVRVARGGRLRVRGAACARRCASSTATSSSAHRCRTRGRCSSPPRTPMPD